MNPFLLRRREHLAHWKGLRKSLALMPEEQQLQEVARYWANAPLRNYAYDVSDPENWLSPWEMMADNNWCRLSTAIGMEFTLRLAGWAPERLSLKFIADYDYDEPFFVLEVDGHWWLNHEYRAVIPATANYDVLYAWTYDENRYIAANVMPQVVAA